jgi:hypothetical protein
VILHFGYWHGEPPLVSQVYSERVLTSRVPLLLRGKPERTAGIERYTFRMFARVTSTDLTGSDHFRSSPMHEIAAL